MTPTRRQLAAAFKEPSMLAGAIKLYGPATSVKMHYRKLKELMAHYGEERPSHWRAGPSHEMAPAKTFAKQSFFETARGRVERALKDAMLYPCAGRWPLWK